MRIKKFTGVTLKHATETMKEELGDDAIVLSTRKVTKGGILNFLGKEEFEITGAIDEQVVTTKRGFAKQLALAGGAALQQSAAAETTFDSLQKVAEQFEHRLKEKPVAKAETVSLTDVAGYHELKDEVESLKSIVQEVAVHLKYSKMPTLPELLKRAYMRLVEHDVAEPLAAEVTQRVYRTLGEELLANKARVEEAVMAELASLFTCAPIATSSKKTRVVALVGPTGVGKTTTIAKLAAIHKLMYKQAVALISADTYRIGAIEQLKTFAAIADIPMEVVYKPAEMKVALANFKQKDIIFIDTVGRSQRVKRDIAELSKFVAAANADEVNLVLSAATGERTLRETIDNFKSLSPTALIVSKLDEAVAFGQMANIAHQFPLPFAYITVGQSVPDDIKVANNVQLAEMVYTGVLANA